MIFQEHTYDVYKSPNQGFGIAISGGVDNALSSGGPDIIVSDVVPHGPAFGQLQ